MNHNIQVSIFFSFPQFSKQSSERIAKTDQGFHLKQQETQWVIFFKNQVFPKKRKRKTSSLDKL